MIARSIAISLCVFSGFLLGPAWADQRGGPESRPTKSATHAERGLASIYAYDGEKTASGERARPTGFTAAHRTLPFGTRVRVTHRKNGRSVVVRINDRGPFIKGRVIDLTPSAAKALGFSAAQGLAPVTLSVAN